jgi:hypothetical protein
VRLTETDKNTLCSIVGADGVVDRAAGLRVYECDGYTLDRAIPELVLLRARRKR